MQMKPHTIDWTVDWLKEDEEAISVDLIVLTLAMPNRRNTGSPTWYKRAEYESSYDHGDLVDRIGNTG